jgi:hypothetical protein
MSVGERSNSPDPTFGNGLVPFRTGMLLLLIVIRFFIQWVWSRSQALETAKDVKNQKSSYVRTSTRQSIAIVCYSLSCACISERLGYTPVFDAYLAVVFLPHDDHIRLAFQLRPCFCTSLLDCGKFIHLRSESGESFTPRQMFKT